MKLTFVLDECIVLNAQNFCDEHGNEDFTSAALMLAIAMNCHKIAVSDYLKGKYFEKTSDIDEVRHTISMKIIRVINYMLHNSDKNISVSYTPNYPFDNEIPNDDLPIVKTAVFTRALFVTADGRLRQRMLELEIPQRHNIEVLDPKQALSYAQRRDP